MTRTRIICLILMLLLTACNSTTTTTPPKATTGEAVAIAQTPTRSLATNTSTAAVLTSTQTPVRSTVTSTVLPSRTMTTIPLELTGSQAMIEKTFLLHGFQFDPPVVDGDRTGNYGWLELKIANGDPYDMSIWIPTVSIGHSLYRAQIGFGVPRHLSNSQMGFVLEYMHLFITASESDWTEGAAWVDATLPILESLAMQEARTNSGQILVKMNLAPWSEGFAYVLTISADPEDQ
jgi:hypothetical protein